MGKSSPRKSLLKTERWGAGFEPAVGANSYHQAIFQKGPLALKERTSLINTGLVFTVISGLEDVADGI